MTSRAQQLDGQFLRFLLVGSSNFLLGMALFQVVWLFGEPLGALRTPTAQAVAYTIGMMWSFYWNRSWVFRSSEWTSPVGRDALRFFAVQILCLFVSIGLVTAMIDGVGLPPFPGWLAAMMPLVLANYCLVNRWVFPHRSAGPQPRTKLSTSKDER